MLGLNSDALATREEALDGLEALAHDVAAVAALCRSGACAADVAAAWHAVRFGGGLLGVTNALACWRRLEAVLLAADGELVTSPVDGKTLAAGGRRDD
jgi:hypothetical protein